MAEVAIPMAMQIGGSLIAAQGQKEQGASALAAGESQLEQANMGANQANAAAQRRAIEQDRQTKLTLSRATAVGAASGGMGISDVRNEADIARQGEYNALTELYNGKEQARGLTNEGQMALYQGYQGKKAANIAATSTLLKGGSSLFSKYGMGGGTGGSAATQVASSTDSSYYPNSGQWVDWNKASYG